MNKQRFLFFIILIVLCVTSLYAWGNKEKAPSAENVITFDTNKDSLSVNTQARFVKVTGIVRLVGTGLFNDLVISGEREWYIASEDREKLHNLQHRKVIAEGEETARELKFANGMPAGIRYTLRNVKIISLPE